MNLKSVKITIPLLLAGLSYLQLGSKPAFEALSPAALLSYRGEDRLRPIAAYKSVLVEELTWVEVRDRLKENYTRVIIPTGGIEQNGPYVDLNKHDLIARATSIRIAEKLGQTLVAPVVSFVPEGPISPPFGHMAFPGTISVRESTFEALLEDVGSSFISHGFKEIIILGDSGGSQAGMRAAAELLAKKRGNEAKVRFIPEYYNYDAVRTFLKNEKFQETPMEFHEELAFSLQLMALNPENVRYNERIAAGLTSINGVPITDEGRLRELGKKIIEMRSDWTVQAIKNYEGAL